MFRILLLKREHSLDYKAPLGPLASTRDCTKMPVSFIKNGKAESTLAPNVRTIESRPLVESIPLLAGI